MQMVHNLRTIPPHHPRFTQQPQRLITLHLQRRLVQIRIIRRLKLKVRTEILEPRRQIPTKLLRRMFGQLALRRSLHHHHRRMVRTDRQLHITPIRNRNRVVQRLDSRVPDLLVVVLRTLKDGPHLLRRLHIQLRRIPHPIRIVLHLPCRNTDQRVVRIVILFHQEVRIVIAHQRQIHLPRQLDHMRIDRVLQTDMVLQLQIKPRTILCTFKCIAMPDRNLARRLKVRLVPRLLILDHVPSNLRPKVTIDRDQPLRMRLQNLPVHPRLVVKPIDVRLGTQVEQVLPPLVVLREQHQVVPTIRDPCIGPIMPIPRRDIRLHTQNRLDPLLLRDVVELHRRVHVAVVRDRDRTHPKLFDPLDQLVRTIPTIEKRELRMQVQVYK